mgnify:CR=1 FL=1
MIELCRNKIAEIFIENRVKVTEFCNAFDEMYDDDTVRHSTHVYAGHGMEDRKICGY